MQNTHQILVNAQNLSQAFLLEEILKILVGALVGLQELHQSRVEAGLAQERSHCRHIFQILDG